ncbi:MAG: hypothetical protein U0T75_12290 [Chitinophagales bacterium]
MIIIAESGSTKTNWLTEEQQLLETMGFNPMFHSTETILAELQKHTGLSALRERVTAVFFYGASCSSADRNLVVEKAVRSFFPSATTITVDHDLKAAAIATYTGVPGIACILGTGSNSCLFDGKEIYEEVPALGYLLGDEGSGAYFGKRLLAAFCYHELPDATMSMLKEQYGLEKEKIFEAVYKKPNANVYLASFAKVLGDSPDRDYMSKLAAEGFTEFFQHHVCCYKNYQQYPVHFVGSIAHFFKAELEQVAAKFGCELGIVDRNPVYRLLGHHVKQQAS